ncbi:hypothetical protein LZT07_00985 [Vibrio fluvialis]|uniref:DUF6701 domain-containing protein n=2 Tax=Vibrio fluvialis TaxID=676 RepID=UPI001F263ED8|nr:DUF6701 domain-containing protein [Vibrio fluvialis]MCE7635897.1 hypothetical protein [Vibrio fluvialis]
MSIVKRSLLCLCWMGMFFSVSSWAINYNPQFEFGTIPADKCTVSGPAVTCNIVFQNTYTSPPLVFVMSTINANRSNFNTKTTEYPSDLRVWNVNNTQATVKQLLPPNDAACVRLRQQSNGNWRCSSNVNDPLVNYVDAPMENIDYLVIEPGVFEFNNGAKIVAGLVEHNLTYSNAGGLNNNNKAKAVRFSDYGLSGQFASSPGVLVQIQSRNNESAGQPIWLTAIALNPSSFDFDLVLDRSEVSANANLARNEQVAFVAGLGEGFVNGRKFWLGQGSTQNTLNINDQVIKPITEGCTQISNFPISGFTKVPTLLAAKRTRNGNNGGWLRRCSVSKTGVALINEEDMARDFERAHVVEPYSYFLFDKPPTSEVCALFPSPAQTWQGNGIASITIDNSAQILGSPISAGKRYIGFSPTSIGGNNYQTACDGSQCFGDVGLQVKKQQLETFQAPDPGLENVSLWQQNREFSNNESIGSLNVGKGTVTFREGIYWIGSIDLNNGGKIIVHENEKVIIHAKKINISQNTQFSESSNAELIVFVHDSNNSGVDLNNNAEFVGLMYSEVGVRLSNQAILRGALTARTIVMSNSSQIIATDNNCFNPSDDYQVTMTPPTDLALMCGNDKPEFSITTTNNNVAESLGIRVTVSPNESNFVVSAANGKGSGVYPNFTSNSSGELDLQVSVNDISQVDLSQSYTLTVVMEDDSGKSVSSRFKYVPFKFEAYDTSNNLSLSSVDVIAGKAETVNTRILACDETGAKKVATNYSGLPSISHVVDSPSGGLNGDLTYSPNFVSGISAENLMVNESGNFTVTLSDSFDCTGFIGCPADNTKDVTGSFVVNSRPWTFAICSGETSALAMDGTSSSGAQFKKASERFNLHVKPIVWQSGGAVTGEIETSNYCNAPITQNFFANNAPSATIEMNSALHSPVGGNSSVVLQGDSGLTKAHNSGVGSALGQYYDFNQLYWDEVGSLKVMADTQTNYLGMDINLGYRNIGRFSPDHVALISNDWEYTDGHDGFVYMNQTIPYRFTVEAQNMQGEPTTNYSAFASDLIADVKLLAVDDQGQELGERIRNYALQLWDGSGSGVWTGATLSVTSHFTFLKKQLTASPYATKADGPYRSGFGLRVSDKVDGVDFLSPDLDLKVSGTRVDTGKRFTLQPDIRYGRMALGDVGGTSVSTINVPLRVEYWQGSRFAINADDSGSYFATPNEYVCKQTVWPTSGSGSSSKLTGSDTPSSWAKVASGKSSVVFATPASSDETADVREQVRFWLRLDDDARSSPQLSESGVNCGAQYTSQPWLQYNWRDKGDEDPSAVVTFGIHRGNDKVIFRGETRLTGQ